MATQMSKKRKFVADGVFFAELNEVLTRELAEDGYSGVEVRVTPMRTEIIIRATRTQNVLGEKGRRIRELTSVVQKRFSFPEGSVELYAEKVNNRGLCAIAQAESLRYKLLGGLAVRRACYGVLRFIMESGAKGCEVIVSGKLRAQRAKSMKFKDGYMISSGQPVNEYIDSAVRHVLLRQGVLGIKVKIMLDWDPKGKQGPTTPLPDVVTIHQPKMKRNTSGLQPCFPLKLKSPWLKFKYPTCSLRASILFESRSLWFHPFFCNECLLGTFSFFWRLNYVIEKQLRQFCL
ncbi:40S ribosomal protein S3-3 [Acorus calamus]|uniref:30S ribosomal protein S3, chloroplastic n=1 Tax=Acorus calamus TaxID=4465 RepID=A0AAV9ET44_ACOCL|nr:40S ribosomal protein S3-3 [Acorus calamus]